MSLSYTGNISTWYEKNSFYLNFRREIKDAIAPRGKNGEEVQYETESCLQFVFISAFILIM